VLPTGGPGAAGRIASAMRYCVLSGGKRFRPLLCLGGAEAVGGQARRALKAACAIELIHTYSLVHDDLPAMDDAATRRGRPSCHLKFGEGIAILAGDALLTLAFELLGRNPSTRPQRSGASLGIVPSERSASRDNGTPNALGIVHTLGRGCGTTGLIGGQALDLDAMQRPRAATAGLLREIARQKTAALITASVVIGGLAGGGTPAQRARLDRFGRHLGLAFQLIDDVHDRDGLAAALGPEAALEEARRLIRRASEALAPFGMKAQALKELAGWLTATA
jgi:geranylgeranyl diphosphate synthase type II